MGIATMLDASNSSILNDMELLGGINDKLEMFILLYVLFKCIELVRIGFARLYKGKGV